MESANRTVSVHYRTAAVGGVNVFYCEAGPASAPVVLLLHGFPSSSCMFRDLIPRLSDADRGAAPLIDRSHRVEPKSRKSHPRTQHRGHSPESLARPTGGI
jgi:hypothetical protein